MRVWDVQSFQEIAGPFQHDSGINCLGFDENISKIAKRCDDGSEKVWDVETGSCILTSLRHQWNCEMHRRRLSRNG